MSPQAMFVLAVSCVLKKTRQCLVSVQRRFEPAVNRVLGCWLWARASSAPARVSPAVPPASRRLPLRHCRLL